MVEGNPTKNFFRALLYLSPALILLGIFTFYPLINTFIISFKEGYNFMIREGKNYDAIGFGNYEWLMDADNPYFKQYLLNTSIIVFVSVPVSLILALLISVALHSIKAFQKVLQTVFFLPYVTNTIAIGMVFAVIFESRQGLANAFIRMCGGVGINWLGGNTDYELLFSSFKGTLINAQYLTSLTVLLIYIVWNSLPFKILILLSSLQSIDKQYYQAAQIDGASKFRTFMRITVPFLSPQLFYLLITSFIGAWKEYTSVVAIFGVNASSVGAQNNNMATIVWFIYQKTKVRSDTMGQAAATAVVLFIIILLFTALNRYVSNKKVHY